jgi:DNA-binding MarR family transcriptional regulator
MVPDLSKLGCNCFAIRQAARAVSQLYDRHLAPAGLTTVQYTILNAIARAPGVSMADLALGMVVDRTTLVRALKPLQREGLVEAVQESASSRAMALHLSAQGSAAVERGAALWLAAQHEFEEKFGQHRARELRSALFEVTEDV